MIGWYSLNWNRTWFLISWFTSLVGFFILWWLWFDITWVNFCFLLLYFLNTLVQDIFIRLFWGYVPSYNLLSFDSSFRYFWLRRSTFLRFNWCRALVLIWISITLRNDTIWLVQLLLIRSSWESLIRWLFGHLSRGFLISDLLKLDSLWLSIDVIFESFAIFLLNHYICSHAFLPSSSLFFHHWLIYFLNDFFFLCDLFVLRIFLFPRFTLLWWHFTNTKLMITCFVTYLFWEYIWNLN